MNHEGDVLQHLNYLWFQVKRTIGFTAILSLFLTHSKDSNFCNCFRVYIGVR